MAMNDALDLFSTLTDEERGRTALVFEGGAWTFGDLARRAAALAGRLRERGIGGGSRVGFVAGPSPEVVLTIVALAGMGATLVPIHPRLSAAEARVVLDVARAEHTLDPDEMRALASAAEGAAASNATAPWSGPGPATGTPATSRALGSGGAAAAPGRHAGAAPFAIVSTSGTAGQPKGAVLSRRAILASAAASEKNLGWRDGDRWLACMPLAHVGGLSIVTRCLVARRTMVLLPRFDAGLVLDAVRRHAVTLLSVVPTMLHALLEADTTGALAAPRALLLGGAAAPPALLDACAERRVRALTTYGLTEACSQVTTQAPRDPSIRLAGSGAPLDGFELRIAAEDGSPLPTGTAGRILIGGPALFDGYLTGMENSPYSEPVPPPRGASGLFDTGDIGELDGRGQLHVHVRRTDLVVTGGENVYPAEVEQALERCPGVRRALVLGVPDERWGQIVAAVVAIEPALLAVAPAPPRLDAPAPASVTDLRRALADLCATALAPHKRPRRLALVADLPLTPSGKVDRRDALARFAGALQPFP